MRRDEKRGARSGGAWLFVETNRDEEGPSGAHLITGAGARTRWDSTVCGAAAACIKGK
jgi:hypothetical protein